MSERVEQIMRGVRAQVEKQRRDALELLVGGDELDQAVTTMRRQYEVDGEEAGPEALRRALCRWLEEMAARMLDDVEWWTRPYRPAAHRFLELFHAER